MAVTCFSELIAPHKGHGLASKRVAVGAMFFCKDESSNNEASAGLQWESESLDVRSLMAAVVARVAAGWEREREAVGRWRCACTEPGLPLNRLERGRNEWWGSSVICRP